MRAIIALSLRMEDRAAPALLACALHNLVDVVKGLAIVNSLRLARGPQSLAAMQDLIKKHSARAIQQAAADAIGGASSSIESTLGSRKG